MIKETVILYIDQEKIYTDRGTTILEAARQNGIDIPTLCYHPRLEPLGHCRLCIVEVEGLIRPITSCDNPVSEGMKVTTNTPKLKRMREQILELSLSTHPYEDCLTCVRTGTCELQENAYSHQVELPAQISRAIPEGEKIDNPYIVRDEEKCILCGRCIQICRSGPGRFVYAMIGKGVDTRVVPWRDGREVSLEEAGCIFCGQCVDVCPVAAITEQGRNLGGREWELENVPGICLECSLGCFFERRVFGEEIIKITVPDEGDSVGWLCFKGKFGFKEDETEGPLNAVLVRHKGELVETAYDEAIKIAAEELGRIKEDKGPAALALLASGRHSNEEIYLLNKLCREVLETAVFNLGAEPAWIRAAKGLQAVAGEGICSPTPYAISRSEAILIVGSGLKDSHPVAAMAVERAGRFGDSVIISTADESEDAAAWDRIILADPAGSVKSLFEELSSVLEGKAKSEEVKNGQHDKEIIKKVSNLLNSPSSSIIVTASFFAEADDGDVDALLGLAESCGCLKQGKSRLLLLSNFSNAAGALVALGTTISGHDLTDPAARNCFSREDIVEACKSGTIKGLISFGGDFSGFDRGGLTYLLSVSDRAGRAPKEADLIFPGQPIKAKSGFFTNSAGQTRLNDPIVRNNNMRQDWKLVCDLARAMGVKWHYRSLEEIREEMGSLVTASDMP